MISILLATYNGEKYISQQLDSIINQSVSEFKIFICDDCSSDRTIDIIKGYLEIYPEKIYLEVNKDNSGSASSNFMKLMKKHKDDYIMLCDQDDIWLPDKIEKSLKKIKHMEIKYGVNMPLLVHTDLCVVDNDLKILDKSYIHRVNANYSKNAFNNEIIQNTLTGNTAIYNMALANLITNEPKYMVMHDWWLILIASAFGKVDYIEEATILYRQHKDNIVGSTNMRSFLYMLKRFCNKKDVVKAIDETYLQAESFLEVYEDTLSDELVKFLYEYIEIPKLSKLKRLNRIIKLNTFKNGFLRNIAYILFI